MKNLSVDMPEVHLKMGHPPANRFIPKYEDIVSKKVTRQNQDKPGSPVLLSEACKPNMQVWFKQDDFFEQPKVLVTC